MLVELRSTAPLPAVSSGDDPRTPDVGCADKSWRGGGGRPRREAAARLTRARGRCNSSRTS